MGDPEGDAMAAQYAADLRHDDALKYAERVIASPGTFHEDEVLLAEVVTTLRAQIKRWMDDYYRMNSLHERALQSQRELVEALKTILVERGRAVRQFTAMNTTKWVEPARAALRAAGVEDVP